MIKYAPIFSIDYVVKSPLSDHTFTLNICRAVKTQLWSVNLSFGHICRLHLYYDIRNVLHLAEDQVSGFYRGQHGDFAIGSTNSTLKVVDGSPVLYMQNGSPCPNAGDSNMLANTAIRFICERSMFGTGQSGSALLNLLSLTRHCSILCT